MRWDYSVNAEITQDEESQGRYRAQGLKIIKKLYDDNDNLLTEMATTIDDAILNSEPEFLQEYYDAARTLFTDQVNFLFTKQDTVHIQGGSGALSLGNKMNKALNEILALQISREV
jgi:hypothetical protein